MHLRTEVMSRCVTVLAVAAALLWSGSFLAADSAPLQQPTATEIARALETVRADPNLAPLRTIRILRWRDSGAPKRSGVPAWLTWLGEFLRWLDQTARVLVWAVAIALGGALLVYLARLVSSRSDHAAPSESIAAPVRVHDLDIRPESLPSDIGGTARRLWDGCDHRAALALLYRGMLSRFVHVHQIPVRDSTTEADCLVLASKHLETTRSDYASRLVRVWQRAVYGREQIEDRDVYGLCDGFDAALGGAAVAGSGRGA